MSKFHYDSDDLGYDIISTLPSPLEGEGARRAGEGDSSISPHFGEAEEKKVVWECQVPPCPAGQHRGTAGHTAHDGSPEDANTCYNDSFPPGGTRGHVAVVPQQAPAQADGAPPAPAEGSRGQPVAQPAPPTPPDDTNATALINREGASAEGIRGVNPPPTWHHSHVDPANNQRHYYRSDGRHAVLQYTPGANGAAGSWHLVPNSVRAGNPPPARPTAPGAPRPNAPTAAPTGTQEMGVNDGQLRQTLRARGLQDGEIDAFMSRFPSDGAGPTRTRREREIAQYLPSQRGGETRAAAQQIENRSLEELRANIQENLRNRICDNARNARPPITPQRAYDNLLAQGLVAPGHRPADNANWASVNNGRDWATRSISPQQARDMGADRLFARTPAAGSITDANVLQDTQRHNYVNEARRRYVQWAQSPTNATPPAQPGLGLSESEANDRFNTRAEQLQLMRRNPDNSYSVRNDWSPTDTNPNSPAQSFFTGRRGENIPPAFNPEGALNADTVGSFRHENPISAEPTNPVDRVARQAASVQVSRDAYYAALTGQDPDGNGPMRVVEEGGKHYLVGPDPSHPGQELRQEIRVMGPPPLTRDEALAVMQAQNLTDQEGRPLPNVNGDNFTSRLGQIQSGGFGRSQALYQAAQWERSQISGILSRPPYSKNAQEITRYMQSRGWLGDNADVGQMEQFRREAFGATPGSTEATRINGDITRANVPAHEPQDLTERDRAATIRDNLRTGPGSQADQNARENRSGREAGSRDAAANRDTQRDVARMNNESQERIARENREAQREEQQRQRDFQAHENALQRENATQLEEMRSRTQKSSSLLQFLGTMMSALLQFAGQSTAADKQAMAQIAAASISKMGGGRVG